MQCSFVNYVLASACSVALCSANKILFLTLVSFDLSFKVSFFIEKFATFQSLKQLCF